MPLPFLLTLTALVGAPLLGAAAARAPRWEAAGQGFTTVSVAGLVLLQVVPFGVAQSGWWALLALVVGLLAGQAAHRFPSAEAAARWLACAALLVHGVLDGAALSLESVEPGAEWVAWAVVLHSLPVGLATWRLGVTMGGLRLGVSVVALVILATVLGFFGSGLVLAGTSSWVLAMAQCGVAGTLLHVLLHLAPDRPGESGAGGVGAVLGALALGVVGAEHPVPTLAAGELSASSTLLALAPPVAVATLLGAAFAPSIARFFSRARGGALLAPGTVTGVLLVLALLGPVAAVGAVAAYALGDIAERRFLPSAIPAAPAPTTTEWSATAPWLLAGAAGAALAEPMLDLAPALSLPPVVLALLLVSAALPAWVRWAAAAPVLAVLVHKGLPAGVAVTALVAAEGISTHGLLAAARAHGWPASAQGLLCWGAAGLLGGAVVDVLPASGFPFLHRWAELPWLGGLAAALGLAVASAVVLFRAGPLGFVAPLQSRDSLGGSHSSTRLPSGSHTQANRP